MTGMKNDALYSLYFSWARDFRDLAENLEIVSRQHIDELRARARLDYRAATTRCAVYVAFWGRSSPQLRMLRAFFMLTNRRGDGELERHDLLGGAVGCAELALRHAEDAAAEAAIEDFLRSIPRSPRNQIRGPRTRRTAPAEPWAPPF